MAEMCACTNVNQICRVDLSKKILLLLHFLFSRNFFSRSQAKIHFSDRFPVVFLSCQAILRFTGTVKAKKSFCFPYYDAVSRSLFSRGRTSGRSWSYCEDNLLGSVLHIPTNCKCLKGENYLLRK